MEKMWNEIFQMEKIKKMCKGEFAYKITTNSIDFSVHYKKPCKEPFVSHLKKEIEDTRVVGSGKIFYFIIYLSTSSQ